MKDNFLFDCSLKWHLIFFTLTISYLIGNWNCIFLHCWTTNSWCYVHPPNVIEKSHMSLLHSLMRCLKIVCIQIVQYNLELCFREFYLWGHIIGNGQRSLCSKLLYVSFDFTEPANPSAPLNLTEGETVIEKDKISIIIHWLPPKKTDLPIHRYKVSVL